MIVAPGLALTASSSTKAEDLTFSSVSLQVGLANSHAVNGVAEFCHGQYSPGQVTAPNGDDVLLGL